MHWRVSGTQANKNRAVPLHVWDIAILKVLQNDIFMYNEHAVIYVSSANNERTDRKHALERIGGVETRSGCRAVRRSDNGRCKQQ